MLWNPQPLELMALVLALPGVWWFATGWVAPLETDPQARRALTLAAAVSLWLVAVVSVGRGLSSLDWGIGLGTAALGLLGTAWRWRERARQGPRDPGGGPRRGSSTGLLPTALLVTVPAALLAFGTDIYDESTPMTCHRNQVGELQNDFFPPRNLLFPQDWLRYHYGYNVICAAVTAMTRMSAATAIDLVVVFCVATSWGLAWVVGDRLAGDGAGRWTAVLCTLGGGVAPLVQALGPRPLNGDVTVAGVRVISPLFAFYFQRPFALGIPLTLAALLLVHGERRAGEPRREALLAIVLGALSLVHVVLFVTVTAAYLVDRLLSGRLRSLVVVAAATALAAAQGGVLFTRMAADAEPTVELRVWAFGPGLGPVLGWHLLGFGVLLPLALGLAWLGGLRRLLTIALLGALAVPNLARSPHSFNITKFSVVALLICALGGGCAVKRLMRGRPWRRAAAVALLLCATIGGVIFTALELARAFPPADPRPSADRLAAVRWLREHVAATELVYPADDLLAKAGLPVPGPLDYAPLLMMGVGRGRLRARQVLLATEPSELDSYRRQGVAWIVDDGEAARLAEHVARWCAAGEIELAARLGEIDVYRVLSRPSGPTQ